MVILHIKDDIVYRLSKIILSWDIRPLKHFKCIRSTKASVPYPVRIMLFYVSLNELTDLLVSIMLLSQDRMIIIFTVKFEINNIAFTLKIVLKANPIENWTKLHCRSMQKIYRKVSNIRRTLVRNRIVDHSDVVGASPVGTAPTTSSLST